MVCTTGVVIDYSCVVQLGLCVSGDWLQDFGGVEHGGLFAIMEPQVDLA